MFIVLLNTTIYFFFNDTATTEIYTLSLHDALPICVVVLVLIRIKDAELEKCIGVPGIERDSGLEQRLYLRPFCRLDRKSTRLNSSHLVISYAVFCLKKKNKSRNHDQLKSIVRYVST